LLIGIFEDVGAVILKMPDKNYELCFNSINIATLAPNKNRKEFIISEEKEDSD
jgi:hypothetical protein